MSSGQVFPFEQQEAAAKYFTMSNMAMLEHANERKRYTKDIHTIYSQVDGIVASECGEPGMLDELKSWKKEIAKAKSTDYVATEWEKVKADWTW